MNPKGRNKPIGERNLPAIVDGKFFSFKEDSRTEKGFTAICCTCKKESSVPWGINSTLVRHLKTKGHETILAEYQALRAKEEENRGNPDKSGKS